jgi:uncharacterized phage-associated protein
MSLKFAFNESKAVETLAYIAQQHPGLTAFYVSKVLFFSEKWHLNRYGRPIIADTYIAMPKGPVPSMVKNYLDQNWHWTEQPKDFGSAVKIDTTTNFPKLMPGTRKAKEELLSKSDMSCIVEAIKFCTPKSIDELSKLTHFEKSWKSAEANGAMDYANFIDDDNPHKDEILEMVEENASYAIL